MGFLSSMFGKKNEMQSSQKSIQCKPGTVYSPVEGEAIPLSQVKDDAFAGGLLGQGMAVEPEDDCLYAPVDGELTVVFPTGHAVGLKTPDGMEILVHVGIDTVEANGEGFDLRRKQGEIVKAGEFLGSFDRRKLQKAGYLTTVMVVVTNADSLGEMSTTASGHVQVLDELYHFGG